MLRTIKFRSITSLGRKTRRGYPDPAAHIWIGDRVADATFFENVYSRRFRRNRNKVNITKGVFNNIDILIKKNPSLPVPCVIRLDLDAGNKSHRFSRKRNFARFAAACYKTRKLCLRLNALLEVANSSKRVAWYSAGRSKHNDSIYVLIALRNTDIMTEILMNSSAHNQGDLV